MNSDAELDNNKDDFEWSKPSHVYASEACINVCDTRLGKPRFCDFSDLSLQDRFFHHQRIGSKENLFTVYPLVRFATYPLVDSFYPGLIFL